MLVIVDNSVIISVIFSKNDSYARAIFTLAKEKKIQFITTKEIFEELQYATKSKKIKKLALYRSSRVGSFIAWYKYNALFVELPEGLLTSKKVRDPNDIVFLELAETTNAAYLITYDKDLLILKEICGTKIVTPKEFLEQ